MDQQLENVSVNGIQMKVLVEGAGHPLLFVHGFPLNHQMWRPQIDYFKSNYHVIAPDLRGFGQSDVSPGTVTMRQHAEDLNELLKQLQIQEPLFFCGLSMGGYIAWEFWKHFPERLRALILCDTRAGSDTAEGIQNRLKMADLVLKHGPGSISSSMIPNLISPSSQQNSPEIKENLMHMIESTDPEGIAASQRGMAERHDYLNQLSEIQQPALCLVGSEDQLTSPETMQQMSAQMPHSEYVEIPDTGHMAPMERPQEANQAIERFLAAH